MTKPVTRRLAVDCLLHRVILQFGTPLVVGGEELRPEMDIQFDHVHADVFGGPHEYQNLRPMPRLKHQKKTARDIKDNAKIDRILGLTCTGPKKQIKSRPLKSGNSFERNRAYRVAMVGERSDVEVEKANARLIAAAPEMLEALKMFCSMPETFPENEFLEGVGRMHRAFESARAAISKASTP